MLEQKPHERNPERAYLDAALAGDHRAFEQLTAPYRRELLVHCYRLLGSLVDAEDVLQETWLRAWRRLASFEGRAPFRAWLYGIATYAALDAQNSRRRRLLPMSTHPSADPNSPLPGGSSEILWLEPLPDALLVPVTDTPETVYEARESVSLAFLAAIQYLPGRQRAVLLLRDVLEWPAKEVADLLEMTVAAVNSALQRARATMKTHHVALDTGKPVHDARTAMLLDEYVSAWEAADAPRLVALLRDDAILTMPPSVAWYRGAASIGVFLTTHLFTGDTQRRFRLIPTRANGAPAFDISMAYGNEEYQPLTLQVLTLQDNRIAAIHSFITDGRIFGQNGSDH